MTKETKKSVVTATLVLLWLVLAGTISYLIINR